MTPDTDSTHINYLLNHPSIYDQIRGPYTEPMDMTQILSDSRNVVLTFDKGGIVFLYLQPGIYEAHTAFLPEGRGRNSIRWTKDVIDWMFINTDACEIVTRCPEHKPETSSFAKLVGLSFEFTTIPLWPTEDGNKCMDVYSLKIEDWIKKSDSMVKAGDKFHHDLHDQYDKLGYKMDVHEEDESHDRYAGACVSMVLAGKVDKGINFYNRWSMLSGYARIGIESREPLIIDIVESKILVKQNSFEVL